MEMRLYLQGKEQFWRKNWLIFPGNPPNKHHLEPYFFHMILLRKITVSCGDQWRYSYLFRSPVQLLISMKKLFISGGRPFRSTVPKASEWCGGQNATYENINPTSCISHLLLQQPPGFLGLSELTKAKSLVCFAAVCKQEHQVHLKINKYQQYLEGFVSSAIPDFCLTIL